MRSSGSPSSSPRCAFVANVHPSLRVFGRSWLKTIGEADRQWRAFCLPFVCLVLAFHFVRTSSDLLYTVMSGSHKRVLFQAKSCCVFERGGLLFELSPFFFPENGRVSLDWFLCLLHNGLWMHSVCKYFNSQFLSPNIVFALSTRSEYWCVTSDDCRPLLQASVALSCWEPVIWRQEYFHRTDRRNRICLLLSTVVHCTWSLFTPNVAFYVVLFNARQISHHSFFFFTVSIFPAPSPSSCTAIATSALV